MRSLLPLVFKPAPGWSGALLLALVSAPLGCHSPDSGPSASAKTSSAPKSEPVSSSSAPATTARVPYTGPVGALSGVVRVTGDDPPPLSYEEPMPPECAKAREMYSKLFRVGADRALADALVGVVGYQGYVPAKAPSQRVTIEGCAFSARTLALTEGQTIDVANLDPRDSYLPQLLGAHSPATIVAIPRGEPVRLHPREAKRYLLQDQMGRDFMKADVFVLKYSTAAVTGLDGRYRIEGIPVGPVKVSALLPAADFRVAKAETTIREGDNTLDLTIHYSRDGAAAGDAGVPADASALPAASSVPSASK